VTDGPEIDGHSGSVRVRSTVAFEAKQKIPYFLGVSNKTAGAKDLSLNLVVVPPKGKAEPRRACRTTRRTRTTSPSSRSSRATILTSRSTWSRSA